jgi:hypothetical protein
MRTTVRWGHGILGTRYQMLAMCRDCRSVQVGGVLDELSLENIRQISKNITSKFGATRSEADECDSDAVV